MKKLLYHLYVWFSRISAFLSTHKSLHTARFAFLHELVSISLAKAHISKRMSALFLAGGTFDQVLCVRPTKTQNELGNMALIGKTRIGKGLNIETNLLAWPYSVIVNDIKQELWFRTAGFREKGLGLGGKAFMFDPRGYGHRYDPLEGKYTDSDLRSAATTLLYRSHEKENAVFTERAITMLVQIFHAAVLEGQRLLPFTYKTINEGIIGVATILEIISQKHNCYPNLATKFLDVNYEKADFDSKFLQDCWSTLTARMNQILTKESVRCFTGSDFTAKDIITSVHPVSLFLCWPEQDLLSLAPLIQLIWSSLINGMIATYDSLRGEGCFRVLAILDEILRTGLPKLPEYATTVCGRNISLLISAQSRSQMDAEYGVFNANKLRGQIDSIVYYRPAPDDYETMAHIEKLLGYKSGFAHSKSEHENGMSTGENEQRIPLIPAHETELIDDTQVIVKRSGMRPILAERLNWHDFPELERRGAMKPPDVPVLPAVAEKLHNGFHTPRFPIPLFQPER